MQSTADPPWRFSFEDAAQSLQIPWYAALGNHDYRGDPQAQVRYTQVSKRWRMPARYYKIAAGEAGARHSDLFAIDTSPLVNRYRDDVHGAHRVRAYINGHDHDLQHIRRDGMYYIGCGAGRVPRRAGVWILGLTVAWSGAPAGELPPSDSLDAIVVKSEKLTVQSLIDRKVYSVASDAQSSFGTLSDILSIIPSVDVDPTGVVSLRGDTKVLILIDGKRSNQFASASAGDNLQSIPARDIERIEVLTTPPPQFKADGVAGVINIITRKGRPGGTPGNLQLSGGSGGRYVLGADGGYRYGPLAASLSAGYRQEYRERQVQSAVSAPDPSSGQLLASRNSITERIRREVPTLKLSADYALNDRLSINGSASWADRGGLRTYTQLTDGSAPDGRLLSSARRLSWGHDPETDLDETLTFAQKLGSAQSLDLSLHRSTSHQHEHYNYTNDSFIPPTAAFYNNLSFQENHGTTEFGADYALPISKVTTVKLGYALEQDDFQFDNVGNTVDPTSGIQVPDPALTNEFKFRQVIHAAYASYQASLGTWTWLAGARAEEARTDARQPTNGVMTANHYFKIYPSLHWERAVPDNWTLSFGASARVSRPDPAYLNPYVDHEYTPNLQAGNPRLKPQYSKSFEVGIGYEGKRRSFGLTGYYRRNQDTVTDVTEYLVNGLSLTTKTNLPKDTTAGLEFGANGRVWKKLTYGVSGNFFHSQIDATALGISGLQSTTGLNAKAKLDYRPTDADSAQISVSRTDKRLTPQGYVAAINIVNLGYKHRFSPPLTAVATITDVGDGQKLHRYSASPAFTQDYRRTVVGRILYVGIVYAFGSTDKEQQPSFEYDQQP